MRKIGKRKSFPEFSSKIHVRMCIAVKPRVRELNIRRKIQCRKESLTGSQRGVDMRLRSLSK